jgi:micrococcal nuclease
MPLAQRPLFEPRRKFRRPLRHWIWLPILLLCIALGWLWRPTEPVLPDTVQDGVFRVDFAVDGDTLQLAGGQRVRLIGVNTPETVKPNWPVEPFGPEASAFTKEFVAGREVRLQFDRERTDQYGRLLAYVWVEDRLLNETLVLKGLARYEPQYKYSAAMHQRFKAAQKLAQKQHLGIWGLPLHLQPKEEVVEEPIADAETASEEVSP